MCIFGVPCHPVHIYPSKVHPWTFWKGHFERKRGQEKQESKIYPSNAHSWRFLKGALWKDRSLCCFFPRRLSLLKAGLPHLLGWLQVFLASPRSSPSSISGTPSESQTPHCPSTGTQGRDAPTWCYPPCWQTAGGRGLGASSHRCDTDWFHWGGRRGARWGIRPRERSQPPTSAPASPEPQKTRKVGIQDLQSKVHNCRFLNRKLRKETHKRKAGIQDLPSKVHSWSWLKKHLWKEKGWERTSNVVPLYHISLPRCNGCRAVPRHAQQLSWFHGLHALGIIWCSTWHSIWQFTWYSTGYSIVLPCRHFLLQI